MTEVPPELAREHLEQAEERAHIIRAIRLALSRWDEVSGLMFRAESTKDMRRELKALLGLDKTQASAVMDMQMRRVAGQERSKIDEILRDLEQEIAHLNDLLAK